MAIDISRQFGRRNIERPNVTTVVDRSLGAPTSTAAAAGVSVATGKPANTRSPLRDLADAFGSFSNSLAAKADKERAKMEKDDEQAGRVAQRTGTDVDLGAQSEFFNRGYATSKGQEIGLGISARLRQSVLENQNNPDYDFESVYQAEFSQAFGQPPQDAFEQDMYDSGLQIVLQQGNQLRNASKTDRIALARVEEQRSFENRAIQGLRTLGNSPTRGEDLFNLRQEWLGEARDRKLDITSFNNSYIQGLETLARETGDLSVFDVLERPDKLNGQAPMNNPDIANKVFAVKEQIKTDLKAEKSGAMALAQRDFLVDINGLADKGMLYSKYSKKQIDQMIINHTEGLDGPRLTIAQSIALQEANTGALEGLAVLRRNMDAYNHGVLPTKDSEKEALFRTQLQGADPTQAEAITLDWISRGDLPSSVTTRMKQMSLSNNPQTLEAAHSIYTAATDSGSNVSVSQSFGGAGSSRMDAITGLTESGYDKQTTYAAFSKVDANLGAARSALKGREASRVLEDGIDDIEGSEGNKFHLRNRIENTAAHILASGLVGDPETAIGVALAQTSRYVVQVDGIAYSASDINVHMQNKPALEQWIAGQLPRINVNTGGQYERDDLTVVPIANKGMVGLRTPEGLLFTSIEFGREMADIIKLQQIQAETVAREAALSSSEGQKLRQRQNAGRMVADPKNPRALIRQGGEPSVGPIEMLKEHLEKNQAEETKRISEIPQATNTPLSGDTRSSFSKR